MDGASGVRLVVAGLGISACLPGLGIASLGEVPAAIV